MGYLLHLRDVLATLAHDGADVLVWHGHGHCRGGASRVHGRHRQGGRLHGRSQRDATGEALRITTSEREMGIIARTEGYTVEVWALSLEGHFLSCQPYCPIRNSFRSCTGMEGGEARTPCIGEAGMPPACG